MEIQTLYLDLLPNFIPFVVTTTKQDGTKINPTVDNLVIYEEDGADAAEIVAANEIGNSPFDPIQLPTDVGKTGLWGINTAKSNFTAGKFYIFLWELTVDAITTHKTEVYFFTNSSSFKSTAVELTSTGETQVNIEATAALNSYDPPTRTEATNDKDEIIVDTTAIKGKTDAIPADPAETSDVTAAHVTTDVLIDAQSAPTVGEIDTQLSGTHGSGSWAGAAGSGGTEVVYNVEVAGSPEQGVSVWVTTGNAHESDGVVAGALTTDSSGNVTFMLDTGITYYIWLRKDGTSFDPLPKTKVWS